MRIRLLWLLAAGCVASAPRLVAQPLHAQAACDLDADSSLTADGPSAPLRCGPALDHLPLRSVREAAALLPGVQRDLATGRLGVRAFPGLPHPRPTLAPYRTRAGREPVFVVDGVRLADEQAEELTVPFGAVERVEALVGYVPPSVGEAAGGVILVETREGGDGFRAEAEALTSEVTDAYGYNLGAFSASGPLGERGQFSLAGEWRRLSDAMPYGAATYRLSDDAYADLLAHPQVVSLENAAGETRFVPFPWEAVAASSEPFTRDDLLDAIDVPEGFLLANDSPIPAPLTYTADRFERVQAKDDPLRNLTLHGSAAVRLFAGAVFRIGGAYGAQRADRTAPPAEQFASLLYNRDGLYTSERTDGRLYGVLSHDLSAVSSYRLGVSAQRWQFVEHPVGFSDRVEDALGYGDIDGAAATVRRRYYDYGPDGWYVRSRRDGFLDEARVHGTFFQPGRLPSRFTKGSGDALRIHVEATTLFARHHLHLGAEVEQRTHRLYVLDGRFLAAFAADGDPEVGDGVDRYDELSLNLLLFRAFYYGYDAYGLEETDSENIDAYYALAGDATGPRSGADLAPYRPRTYAGFIADRVRWCSATLDVGLRVEAFDARANVLKDIYAPLPIVRAGSLASTPDGIGDDFAVYFYGPDNVVGYRDLDGTFYDAAGEEVDAEAIVGEINGYVRVDRTAPRSSAFERAPLYVVVEPRLRLTLTPSERVRLVGYYSRTARRPAAATYTPFRTYDAPDAVDNARVGPVTLDAFGAGGAWHPNDALTLGVDLFYRQYNGLIQPQRLRGRISPFNQYLYVDEGSLGEYGVDLTVRLAQAWGLDLRADYTLAFADGTYGAALGDVTYFIGDGYDRRFPATFDTRHALTMSASYRMDEGIGGGASGFVGAMVRGLGLGATLSARSGHPYSAILPGASVGNQTPWFTGSAINEQRLPWVAELDLRLDKALAVGPTTVHAFAWAENVLDARNVLAVYRATGEADDDGFLDSNGGSVYIASHASPAAGIFNYLAYTGGPANIGGVHTTESPFFFGQPRRLRVGLRLTW